MRAAHDVPDDIRYLRVFLLSRTARELDALVASVLAVLRDPPPRVPANPAAPVLALPPARVHDQWLLRWDGSFQSSGAAVGITVGRVGASPDDALLRVGVPVAARDASRCEALGPPLAALLVALLPAAPVRLEGDSMFVV